METITREKIRELANKLLIDLNEEEVDLIESEFGVIKDNMELINEIDGLSEVEPAFAPFDLYASSMREDEAEDSPDIENLLKNTGKRSGNEIEVPRVVN